MCLYHVDVHLGIVVSLARKRPDHHGTNIGPGIFHL
ncbi:hypothetical protein SLEP1_g30353 [Rubroshorea leprosula]|uniref:Uncharacterized protein n=1 Tax=Rubroshorea leprosula TaxID=152421 RepID=A0AAV5K6H3_9ROSI|nr:hypothetical protein SLEP1_g30353 [Rubroshorea leprosula]